jgi:hypothetical protein
MKRRCLFAVLMLFSPSAPASRPRRKPDVVQAECCGAALIITAVRRTHDLSNL